MGYRSLKECVVDLEKAGQLVRITEEVDPHLEMAAIHMRVFAKEGPALYFERVKGCAFPCVSNLFGTVERSKFIFRDRYEKVQELVQLRNDPVKALRRPLRYAGVGMSALKALPKRVSFPVSEFSEIKISALPQIVNWPQDGGPFITLPQVYTEDIEKPGVMSSNLGMYRIQLAGNEYAQDAEIGLHYQIHRGIGIHQSKANAAGKPLRVSIFVGGPPSHSLAAVMPLPEGISELTFAGALGGRRFRYAYHDGYCCSADADFIITGEVHPGDNKPEGPFGDHLGYYSLKHPFPVMRVHKVYARRGAIWPFTVVGRPPQEDTAFGALIHDLSGTAIPHEIPGVREVHAVDAAGVHPLLLAVGSERYTPYLATQRPAELLTQANRILGTGQLSLAKFLFIAAGADVPACKDIAAFLKYVFERIDLSRDLHFQTRTTMDTLDYSGNSINEGSKVVIAAFGPKLRQLSVRLPMSLPDTANERMLMPGVLALKIDPFVSYAQAAEEIGRLAARISSVREDYLGIVQIVLHEGFAFRDNKLLNDYLWLTYTRSNPSHDIYGADEFTEFKHWGCNGPMIIDARIKPHHAPVLEKDPATEAAIDRLFVKGGSLSRWA